MSRRGQRDPDSLIHEAARLICEEAVTDYRVARRKAAERLGLRLHSAGGDHSAIEAAALEWLELFGGPDYRRRLWKMRDTAVRAMRMLASFEPRLVGAVVSGAVGAAHRVQLHAFAEQAERIDIFLQDRGIPFEQDERDFRFADGTIASHPLVRFEAADVGVDIAAFMPEERRRQPLSPVDGQPMRRLTLAQAEALLHATAPA